MSETEKNKIIDFISGIEINETPEEKDSVQPISKELVIFFGYNKSDIMTRPQFKVSTPGEGAQYNVDIAVFKNGKPEILVECKKRNSEDGIQQLKKYLSLCEANYGIWFNGTKRIYLKKVIKNNKIFFDEINSIPLYNSINDEIIKKKVLRKHPNLRQVFREIHSYASAHEIGSTTGANIAENLIRILFCKIWDERYKEEEAELEFFSQDDENEEDIKQRITNIFTKVKNQYNSVFKNNEEITFSAELVSYIVNNLKYISLMSSERDVIADAFEVFVGSSLKGEHGQFFTPRNIIRFVLNFIEKHFKKIDSSCKVMDPACGTGGFIVECLDFVWKKISNLKKTEEEKIEEKTAFAQNKVFGFDKDIFVSKITKAYMCIMGDGVSNVGNLDSLKDLKQHFDTVDLIITNPPFGEKIKIQDKGILSEYEMSKNDLKPMNPEILFVELSVKLLRKGGIMAIIVPEGVVGNGNQHFKLREFLFKNGRILSVLSLPSETFKPNTGIKCSIIIFEKCDLDKIKNYETIFVDIKKIGHDKDGNVLYKLNNYGDKLKDENGNYIIDDELNDLIKIEEKNIDRDKNVNVNSKIFAVPSNLIIENELKLYPSYYSSFLSSINVKDEEKIYFTIRDLINNNILESTKNKLLISGKGVNSSEYTEVGVPFLRTSDIKNIEIVRNPQKFVNVERYDISDKILQPYDIIFAKDGKHCVGESALVMPGEEIALIQSHLYVFRLKKNNSIGVNQFNLIAELNTDYFINQVKSAIFTQGTIPTISTNIYKIKIGFYKDKIKLAEQSDKYKKILEKRYELKKELKVNW